MYLRRWDGRRLPLRPISALEPLLDDGDDGGGGDVTIGVVPLLFDDDDDVPPPQSGQQAPAQVLDQPEVDAVCRLLRKTFIWNSAQDMHSKNQM